MISKVLEQQQRLTGDSLKQTAKRYAIFVTGGFMGWLIIVVMQAIFLKYGEILSYWVGLLFADIFTFVYHRLVTFKIKTNWQVRFVQFSVVVTVITVANGVLFSLASSNWSLSGFDSGVILGKYTFMVPGRVVVSFVITFFLSIVNFLVNRILIFRRH